MVFSERVRLGIPTKDELQELESNVMDLQRLASKSATANFQLEQQEIPAGLLPSALSRRRESAPLSRAAQSNLLASERLKGVSRSAANPVSGLSSTSEFARLRTEVTDLKNFNSQFMQSFGFMMNPIGGVQGMALGLGAGIPGVGIAGALAPVIYQMIVAQHGAGGIFDVTKQQLDDTRSIIGLEREIEMHGGENLFLGNVALRQGVPANITSNTQDLRDGMRRYVLQTNQFGR